MTPYSYAILGLFCLTDATHFVAKNYTTSGEALICVSVAGLIVLALLARHAVDQSK